MSTIVTEMSSESVIHFGAPIATKCKSVSNCTVTSFARNEYIRRTRFDWIENRWEIRPLYADAERTIKNAMR
jgi:hypothetical protein